MQPERPSLALPAQLERRARELAAGTGWVAPPALDAATVILVRDTAAGVEVFLQRRVAAMVFAGGFTVFPGGRVEPADAALPWRGDAGHEPFTRPAGAAATATFRALTVAGARETWEEAGVALAQDASGPVAHTPPHPEHPFASWLVEHGLVVAGEAFAAWTHWITPEVESRRYDTRFVVTALPPGQRAVDRGMESDQSSWWRPARVLDEARAGRVALLPPTTDALAQLAAFDTVAAVLAEGRTRRPRPLLPRPYRRGEDLAWHVVDGYTGAEVAW